MAGRRATRSAKPADLRRAARDGIGDALAEDVRTPEASGLGEALIARARAAVPRAEFPAMQSPAEPAEGQIILPRRLPLLMALGFIGTLGGQVFWAGTYTTRIDNHLSHLVESDQRLTARSDERYQMLTERLGSLERDRDRLPKLEERFGRIEEKMTMMLEQLREWRQERLPRR